MFQGFYCARHVRQAGLWECVKRRCLSSKKGRPKPPLLPGTTDKLNKFFTEHNQRFYELVGQDFMWPRVKEEEIQDDNVVEDQ